MEYKVTNDNFEKEVIESTLPCIVDFWATWCGPCMMLGPVLAQIAEEYDGKIKICKVNVDENPELAEKFHVSSIPMMLSFKNGTPQNMMVGFTQKENIVEGLVKGLL